MDAGKAEVLAFTGFPRSHWVKIWSTNPLERINQETKRRSRVVGIFTNEASVIQDQNPPTVRQVNGYSTRPHEDEQPRPGAPRKPSPFGSGRP